jgi:hypothetical protein
VESNSGRALFDWFLLEARDRVLDAAHGSPELQRLASDDLAAVGAFEDAIRELISDALSAIHDPNQLIWWTLFCRSRNNRQKPQSLPE